MALLFFSFYRSTNQTEKITTVIFFVVWKEDKRHQDSARDNVKNMARTLF
jgi:hypothetical protein